MPAHNHGDELTDCMITVGTIWAAVVAISLFAPDLVSGSEHQHLPIAAFTAWIWGAVATGGVLSFWARTVRRPDGVRLHRPVTVAVAAVWLAATAVAVFAPEMVTGSDPTRVPLAAILAPMAAALLTLLARTAADHVGSVFQPTDDRA